MWKFFLRMPRTSSLFFEKNVLNYSEVVTYCQRNNYIHYKNIHVYIQSVHMHARITCSPWYESNTKNHIQLYRLQELNHIKLPSWTYILTIQMYYMYLNFVILSTILSLTINDYRVIQILKILDFFLNRRLNHILILSKLYKRDSIMATIFIIIMITYSAS